METDLRMAMELQQALMSFNYPRFCDDKRELQFSHRYRPASMVGGDFFFCQTFAFFGRGNGNNISGGAIWNFCQSVAHKILIKFFQSGGNIRLRTFKNFFHLERQAVGLVDAADFWIAITRTQQLAKLTEAVKSFVIHFHHEHMVETGENIFQTVRQRIDVANVNGRNSVA